MELSNADCTIHMFIVLFWYFFESLIMLKLLLLKKETVKKKLREKLKSYYVFKTYERKRNSQIPLKDLSYLRETHASSCILILGWDWANFTELKVL